MEKPFLLDRSETELFRFIVDSGKDNNVTTALKSITQDRQQITKDITITEGKIQAIEDTIKRQEEGLKDSDKKLEVYNRVIELGPKIKRVQDLTNLKQMTQLDGQYLSKVLSEKNMLDTLINSISARLDNINILTKKSEIISNLKIKMNATQESLNIINNQIAKIEAIKVPNLSEMINKYKLLSELVSRATGTQNAITELNNRVFPTLSDSFSKNAQLLTTLGSLINTIKYKEEQLNTFESSIKEIKEELKVLDKEIKEIGVCPTCGQPLHNN